MVSLNVKPLITYVLSEKTADIVSKKKRISKKDILGSKATIIQDSKSLSYWIRISIGLVLERPPKRVWNKLYKRLYRVVDFL